MTSAKDLFTAAAGSALPRPHAETPAQPDDLDAVARAYTQVSLREAARQRWEAYCPPEYRESDWEHPKLVPFRQQIDAILAWTLSSKGILASGPTGRGKTRVMWQLMRRLACEEGRDVRCYHAADWFARLQSEVNYGRDDACGWVEDVANRPLVFIDDFGQEAVTLGRQEWAAAWWMRFLDIRVGKGLPLFVTTNMRSEDIAAPSSSSKVSIRGDPLVRRLLDLCEPVVFETAAEHDERKTKR